MFVNATMVETSREAHALNNTVCLLWRYSSIEVSGGFHALDGVVCIYAPAHPAPPATLFLPSSSKALNFLTVTPKIASATSSKAVTHMLRFLGVEELASGRFLLSLLQGDQRNNIFLLCSGPLSSNNRHNGGTNIDALREPRSSLLVL